MIPNDIQMINFPMGAWLNYPVHFYPFLVSSWDGIHNFPKKITQKKPFNTSTPTVWPWMVWIHRLPNTPLHPKSHRCRCHRSCWIVRQRCQRFAARQFLRSPGHWNLALRFAVVCHIILENDRWHWHWLRLEVPTLIIFIDSEIDWDSKVFPEVENLVPLENVGLKSLSWMWVECRYRKRLSPPLAVRLEPAFFRAKLRFQPIFATSSEPSASWLIPKPKH